MRRAWMGEFAWAVALVARWIARQVDAVLAHAGRRGW